MLTIPIKFFPLTILYDILPNMKRFFKSMLFIGILLFVLFFVARFILGQFGLMFRAWINCIWLGSSFVLFMWGSLKFYPGIKNKIVKRILAIITIIALIFTFFPMPVLEFPLGLLLIADWTCRIGVFPNKEDVIETEGYKIICYHRLTFMDSEVEFYEYKNSFVVGNDCLLRCYGYDFDNKDGRFYAYDDVRAIPIEEIVDNIKK